ncbi:MAG: outer membrane beta-barrel protein [Bacteroidia bacterium]|nr:outer membrane beta-barrel protein [Bacteroidia bacterium]
MKRSVFILLALLLVVGSVTAQKNSKDSAFVKIILNGHFKFFKKRIIDTTVLLRKDNKLFIQRNGEWIDTLYFQKKVDEMKKKVDSTGKVVGVPQYSFSGHWTGVELGLNTFMDSKNKLQLPDAAKEMELNTGKSWTFHWNIIQMSPRIYKDKIGLVTGLGWNFNNYNFEKQVTMDHDSAAIRFFIVADTVLQFKKNKLSISYLTIPVLLEFQPCNHFYLSFGVIGSLKLYSRQKQVLSGNRVAIDKNDFYLNPFMLDLTARIGSNMFTLFANYSMTPLFEKNKGPKILPLTVGMALNF